MTTLPILSDSSVRTHLIMPADIAAGITDAIRASKRPNTLRAYQSDLAQFSNWCSDHGWQALPAQPDMVAAFGVVCCRMLVGSTSSH